MRFAYIDSHGNEVPIPSVDALALRIELGAIGPDTDLYDSQADYWGPAQTHEIFHTLSRASEGEGFVAPPPPVVPAPPAGESTPEPAAAAGDDVAASDATGDDVAASDATADEGEGVDLGLTLAEPPTVSAEEETPAAADDGGPGDLALDLAPPPAEETDAGGGLGDAGSPVTEDVPAGAAEATAPADDGASFDFGDLDGGLELEGSPADAAAGASAGGFSDSMDLETSLEFAGGSGDVHDVAGDLHLEAPMSDFQPDSPPGWMEGPDAEADDDAMDFSSVSADAATDEDTPAAAPRMPTGERRTPRDRPSKPRFKKQRSAGPIIFFFVVAALGAGGYYGWPILSAWLAENAEPTRPPVVMPEIPADLLDRMRSLAEAAMADVLEDVERRTMAQDAPTEPDQDWLSDVYLSNASQFANVEAFWLSIDQLMDGMRAAEWQLFHDMYVTRVEAAGVAADTAAFLIERADSGFVAAEGMRRQTYALMEDLVDAAFGLHDLLVANEANIAYEPPSAGLLPVAVPNTAALGDRMEERVDDITSALAALGSLDRVTRERLTTALLARLHEVGIR